MKSCQGHGAGGDAPWSWSPVACKTEAEPDNAQPLRFRPKKAPIVQPPLDSVWKLLCENTNKNTERNTENGKRFARVDARRNRKVPRLIALHGSVQFAKDDRLLVEEHHFPCCLSCPSDVQRPVSGHHNQPAHQQSSGGYRKWPTEEDRGLWLSPRGQISPWHDEESLHEQLSSRQYIKNKPTKCGLKFFVLADVNEHTVGLSAVHWKIHIFIREEAVFWYGQVFSGQTLPWFRVYCLLWQFLYMSLQIPQSWGIWCRWDLQGEQSWCPIHPGQCQEQLTGTASFSTTRAKNTWIAV